MDIFARIHRSSATLVRRLSEEGALPAGVDLDLFAVHPAAAASPFDMVVDAAPVYARAAASVGTDARQTALALAAHLSGLPEVGAAEVVGPGLVAVALDAAARLDAVASTLRAGPAPASRPAADIRGLSPEAAWAAVTAETRAALDAAAGRCAGAGHLDRDATATRRGVVVAGGARAASADIVAAIGPDAFRFAAAACRPDAALHLDLAALADRSRANPAFWVPYAHARFRGVLRRAATALPDLDLTAPALAAVHLGGLSDPGEARLARLVVRHPRAVSAAAAAGAPHRLVAHLRDMADAVHSQWNRSKDQPQLRFVNEEERDLTKARLGLVTASTLVLSSGLGILGITAPDEMR